MKVFNFVNETCFLYLNTVGISMKLSLLKAYFSSSQGWYASKGDTKTS